VKNIKNKIESSPVFRFVSTLAAFAASLGILGGSLLWFGKTTFASTDSLVALESRADKMEVVYAKDAGETRKEIAVIKERQKSDGDKLDDLKKADEKQEKLLYQILMEVRK